MMDMDQEAYSELSLRELRVLDTLLALRSITRTAQTMETTQPAVSKMLRHLRVHFSDRDAGHKWLRNVTFEVFVRAVQ
jgi:Bacterial regulatory helix-turn-helix protein, lysR family